MVLKRLRDHQIALFSCYESGSLFRTKSKHLIASPMHQPRNSRFRVRQTAAISSILAGNRPRVGDNRVFSRGHVRKHVHAPRLGERSAKVMPSWRSTPDGSPRDGMGGRPSAETARETPSCRRHHVASVGSRRASVKPWDRTTPGSPPRCHLQTARHPGFFSPNACVCTTWTGASRGITRMHRR